jgi:hypothetical protein
VPKLRADALDWRTVEGEIVALDIRTSTYLAINRSGARLWPMIVQGTDRETLVNRLVTDYDVDTARATADVGAFLDLLGERGLLEPAPPTPEG